MDWFLYSWPTLILLGLGLRMALKLTYGARGPEAGDPVFVFLNTSSWVMLGLGLVPAAVGGLFTFVGGLIGVLAVTTFIEAMVQRRAAQRRSFATMLALMLERSQPMDSSVLLAHHEMGGIAGRAAGRLLSALRHGTPLADAIAAHPRALPPEALAYLAAGQTKAAEAAALRAMSRGERSELTTVWRACVDRIAYLTFVVATMVAVLTFVFIKIVPEFVKIFQEFGVELPRSTALAVMLSSTFVRWLYIPVGLVLTVLVFGSIILGICYLADITVLRPWFDLLFRGRSTAHVLRILAVATEQRQPLANTFVWLAHVYPSAPVRRRLVAASNAIVAGADWREAVAAARFVSGSELALMKAAERTGNLPWALRQMADRRERRAAYRLAAAVQIGYPIIILLLGGLVAFYVVALFVPIVKLINGLT